MKCGDVLCGDGVLYDGDGVLCGGGDVLCGGDGGDGLVPV